MSFNLDEGESVRVMVGNVQVYVWFTSDDALELSTSVGGMNDNVQVSVDSLTGKITNIKKPNK